MNEILAQMMQFAGVTQNWIWVAALVFVRVSAAVFLMPAFGEQAVPQRIRLVLELALSAIVLPAVAGRLHHLHGSGAIAGRSGTALCGRG